jgi:predicted CXXCH cytochrome family protein
MASPLLHALLAAAVPLSAPTVDFTRDIAPVLAARCFQCHGPDASSRKAGLRLDTAALPQDCALAVRRVPANIWAGHLLHQQA